MAGPRPRQMALAAALILQASATLAQDFERIAPKEPPPNPPVQRLPVPALPPAAVPDGGAVILPALKGLVFVGRTDALRRGGSDTRGISVDGVDTLDRPEFRAMLAPYLGQPVTLDRLNEITRATVVFSRQNDRPLVDVIVPEQDVSSGTVQILVAEFVAGAIRPEGNRWFSDALLTGEVRTRPGERISARSLLDDVNWLNQNPFRRVDLVYQRSTQPGASDIVLRTTDRFPVRVFAGYENTGSQSTERGRTFAGFNWGNALWLDHQFSYQFTTSPDFWRKGTGGRTHFTGHSASYVIPLPWRHKLTVFGSYAESLPKVPLSFRQLGRSSQVSARYAVPLGEMWGATHEVQAGFDWKRSNNSLEFGGTSVSSATSDIAQWMVGYGASRPDDWGLTAFSGSLFLSPGGFDAKNRTAAFQAQRAGAEGRYTYARLGVDRVTTLPSSFSWLVRVQGQLANRTLLPSEQLGFGGEASVRGYDERQVNGDQGLLVSSELRTPEFSLFKAVGEREMADKLQLLAFWDYGVAHNRRLGVGEEKLTRLSSAGVGLRYALAPYALAKVDYGWQFIGAGRTAAGGGRPHFAITFAY